jgi:Tol biopolymer transport system component
VAIRPQEFVVPSKPACLAFFLALFLSIPLNLAHSQVVGVFEGQWDVGSVTPPGTAAFDSATGVYTIHSAGANLWGTTDGFHYLWKKVSGDVSLTANIDFPVKTGSHNEHRKAILIFRQTLDADGAYVDAAQHGVGLTALQFRDAKGATTQSIELNIDPPKRLRLEKHGDQFTMFVSFHGEPLHQVGAATMMHLNEPFYAGIGLSAHDPNTTETATFAHVELKPLVAPATPPQMALFSSLKAIEIDPGAPRAIVAYTTKARAMAPNWSRDGKWLIYVQDGKMYRVAADGSRVAINSAEQIATGDATGCNGSHGLSPDGKWLAITCTMASNLGTSDPGNRVYIVPATGGKPRLVTANPDSYFHSWSPDGKTILFTRPSHGSLNIYAISVDGGAETALTNGSGVSDDPDYSADGEYIYFNSDRWGGMQIARMHADGGHVEQVTRDNFHNWTPHPSPDGKSIVFISYPPDVTTHAANKDVALRILSTSDSSIRVLADLVGGDGSMNVPSWSPDSKSLAFASYEFLPADDQGSSE